MTDTTLAPDTDSAAHVISTGENLRAVAEWLATPRTAQATDDLPPLHKQLAALRASHVAPEQRAEMLDQLYTRSSTVVTELIASLRDVALPVPRKTRDMVRSLHGLLETLIDDLQSMHEATSDSEKSDPARNLATWRNINSLSQHLLISDLVASPAGIGIWGQLHRAYTKAQKLDLTDYTPDDKSASLQQVYQSALLLGCAQPDSFTSCEISFIASYLERYAHHAEPLSNTAPEHASAFWIDPRRDLPAFPCLRKTPPQETDIRFFSCEQLADLLGKQLADLTAGRTPAETNLPDFAGTPAGRGVLTRLAGYWGNPGKRKFPHRRRSDRAELCAGLNRLWLLFHQDKTEKPEVSTWMITNQSPDGYAIMHVGGKTGKLAVGNITAIRSDSEADWQICMVRWALSENPEHLELGLQILAPHAVPAILMLPSDREDGERLPVLILPEIPALRSTEVLVTTSGALHNRDGKLLLIVDQGNVKVREVRAICVEEQTSSVEVFAIESDKSP